MSDDIAARVLHASDKALSWIKWEDLTEDAREEYRTEATKFLGSGSPEIITK